jgi:transcriptional regulator with XRE-family HTH domain
MSEMKKKKITKQRMAELMKTSRAQVDRLLDPDNGSATIESLQRAARIVGRELRLQLVSGLFAPAISAFAKLFQHLSLGMLATWAKSAATSAHHSTHCARRPELLYMYSTRSP